MGKNKVVIEVREKKASGRGSAIRSLFRGVIGVVLAVGAIVFLLLALLIS